MAKILVVDDTSAICEMLVDVLEYEGYSVLVAHDGKQGVELEQDADLVLLVGHLPFPTGM